MRLLLPGQHKAPALVVPGPHANPDSDLFLHLHRAANRGEHQIGRIEDVESRALVKLVFEGEAQVRSSELHHPIGRELRLRDVQQRPQLEVQVEARLFRARVFRGPERARDPQRDERRQPHFCGAGFVGAGAGLTASLRPASSSILQCPSNSTPFSMMSCGVSMFPRTRAGARNSTSLLARMLPSITPSTISVPMSILAFTSAPSPTTRMSSENTSPASLPSMRTVPSKVNLPSNEVPLPRSVLISFCGALPETVWSAGMRQAYATNRAQGQAGIERAGANPPLKGLPGSTGHLRARASDSNRRAARCAPTNRRAHVPQGRQSDSHTGDCAGSEVACREMDRLRAARARRALPRAAAVESAGTNRCVDTRRAPRTTSANRVAAGAARRTPASCRSVPASI